MSISQSIRRSAVSLLGFGLFAASWSGCGAVPGEADGSGGGSGESVASTEQATTGNCNTCPADVILTYSTGTTGDKVGPSTSDYVCWLSGLAMQNSGTSPNGHVFQRTDGKWVLSGLNADMACVPQCCFYSNGGDADRRWVSPEFSAIASSPTNGGTKSVSTAMWNSDAMPILTGLSYLKGGAPMAPLAGEGAYTQVRQPTQTALLNATTRASSTHGAFTYAFGYSYFVGKPSSGHVVKKKEFTVSDGTNRMPLISLTEGICTLGVVQGMFTTSSAAGVFADPATGFWRAGNSGAFTFKPMCYYYNQNK